MTELNFQPLVDALASILNFYLWNYLLSLWFFAALIQRYTRLAKWCEALGWDGLREFLAGFGHSPQPRSRPEIEVVEMRK